ncbi:DUF3564 family protein [Paraburkholderia caballeronis]|uniref:DUF3564 domain-containing protein n=1 Tax=Paraburkholderia caballeronis TaxID=416943 RepID=A0A1H7P3X2_9BURK|nr:DUF3564 family protein [Paraburkholderia caballeronis]PXW25390.1 uncharacterized protein DUF3564 [Paraburkholderia caballeronis]PXX00997.1 uncharacterized protein DUF3564 [Paraburkholderia caballeronis]RAJ99650.1 uncharacterized protein DUF3564 [Paraburkholderia caballeronis]SEE39348.1 Protein of unknown function [Paraburkholderia caballeronis]SEL30560.1 Protein of unknown function [Paraburkholderia caballeronis]
MRITVHLDSFDRIDPSAYAIVWLDKATGKWSREGHAGVALPAWGYFDVANGDTRLNDAADGHPLCVLEGLDFSKDAGPFEGEEGAANWCANAHAAPAAGRWHVQWIDETESVPEYGLFADDHV